MQVTSHEWDAIRGLRFLLTPPAPLGYNTVASCWYGNRDLPRCPRRREQTAHSRERKRLSGMTIRLIRAGSLTSGIAAVLPGDWRRATAAESLALGILVAWFGPRSPLARDIVSSSQCRRGSPLRHHTPTWHDCPRAACRTEGVAGVERFGAVPAFRSAAGLSNPSAVAGRARQLASLGATQEADRN